jgi:hypothetical protein
MTNHPIRVIALVAALAALAIVPAAASAAPTWAPAASATVHPGVQTHTDGAQCTSNFVFTDSAGTVYIGQAAHCSGTGSETDTNGCTSASLPIGTPVTVDGADQPGTLVYNSWLTMQGNGEADASTCQYNDLALVKLAASDASKVNPSIPTFGGPTGVGGPSAAGAKVFSYGNSELRGGITQLSPKRGLVVQTEGDGWSRDVYTLTPGIPGDSGSAFLDASGGAIGVLSTVAIAPLPLSNGVGDLGRELAYAQAHSGIAGLQLVKGTEPFNANALL